MAMSMIEKRMVNLLAERASGQRLAARRGGGERRGDGYCDQEERRDGRRVAGVQCGDAVEHRFQVSRQRPGSGGTGHRGDNREREGLAQHPGFGLARACAPTAMRIPISRVRRVTRYAITP